MNVRKIFMVTFIVISLSLGSIYQSREVSATEWFDSYPKIDWDLETVRLRRLDKYLRDNPDSIAFVVYRWRNKGERNEMKRRADRARRYLTFDLKNDKHRIIVVDAGLGSESITILEPIQKDSVRPNFKELGS